MDGGEALDGHRSRQAPHPRDRRPDAAGPAGRARRRGRAAHGLVVVHRRARVRPRAHLAGEHPEVPPDALRRADRRAALRLDDADPRDALEPRPERLPRLARRAGGRGLRAAGPRPRGRQRADGRLPLQLRRVHGRRAALAALRPHVLRAGRLSRRRRRADAQAGPSPSAHDRLVRLGPVRRRRARRHPPEHRAVGERRRQRAAHRAADHPDRAHGRVRLAPGGRLVDRALHAAVDLPRVDGQGPHHPHRGRQPRARRGDAGHRRPPGRHRPATPRPGARWPASSRSRRAAAARSRSARSCISSAATRRPRRPHPLLRRGDGPRVGADAHPARPDADRLAGARRHVRRRGGQGPARHRRVGGPHLRRARPQGLRRVERPGVEVRAAAALRGVAGGLARRRSACRARHGQGPHRR
jgi:hypothetical protein